MRVENGFKLSNPRMYYKLDPGERGVPFSAPASLSILRVAGHELGNIVQFKSKALQQGGYVVYSRIKLNFTDVGGFLAAKAGQSVARIIYPEGKKDIYNPGSFLLEKGSVPYKQQKVVPENPESEATTSETGTLQTQEESSFLGLNSQDQQIQSLNQKQTLKETEQLEQEKAKLQKKKQDIKTQTYLPDEEKNKILDEIDQKIKEIDSKIAKKQVEETNKKLAYLLYDVISKSNGMVFNFVKARYNMPIPQPVSQLDLLA